MLVMTMKKTKEIKIPESIFDTYEWLSNEEVFKIFLEDCDDILVKEALKKSEDI